MANSTTQDVTIWNEAGSNSAEVELTTNPQSSGGASVSVKNVPSDIPYVLGYTERSIVNDYIELSVLGGLNVNEVYPHLESENQLTSDTILQTNGASTRFLQIFKASAKSIHSIRVRIGLAATSVTIDTFDSGVVANWISSDAGNTIVTAEATIVFEGTGSMRVQTKAGSVGDTVTRTIASTDYSSTSDFSFAFYSDHTTPQFRFRIGDGTNTLQSPIFSAAAVNTWQVITIPITSFTEVGAGTTNTAAITKVSFQSVNGIGAKNYFDILKRTAAVSTPTNLRLYSFGATSNPANISAGTSLNNDSGVATSTLNQDSSSATEQTFPFLRGVKTTPANDLVVGQYYGFEIDGLNIQPYGSNTQTYTSANCYTRDTGTGVLTALNKSAFFEVMYVPDDCYIYKARFYSTDEMDDSAFTANIVNNAGTKVLTQIMRDVSTPTNGETAVEYPNRHLLFTRGQKVLLRIQADPDAPAFTDYNFELSVFNKPITRNG